MLYSTSKLAPLFLLLAFPLGLLAASPTGPAQQEAAGDDVFTLEGDLQSNPLLLLWELEEIGWEDGYDLSNLEPSSTSVPKDVGEAGGEAVAGMQQMLSAQEWELLERLRVAFDDRCLKQDRLKCISTAWAFKEQPQDKHGASL